jgi:hypothetical protein
MQLGGIQEANSKVHQEAQTSHNLEEMNTGPVSIWRMPTLQDTHMPCIAGYAVAGLRVNYNPSEYRSLGLVID